MSMLASTPIVADASTIIVPSAFSTAVARAELAWRIARSPRVSAFSSRG